MSSTKGSSVSGLSDYLWGIETKFPDGSCCTWSGFQTTYEELKQFIKSVALRHKRFQTTYEELKPAVDVKATSTTFELSDYLWGIETQFEETYGPGT